MDKMDFENSIKTVDGIISKLSSGDVPLDEAIELYKTGANELARCKKQLDEAEKAVMKVTCAEDL